MPYNLPFSIIQLLFLTATSQTLPVLPLGLLLKESAYCTPTRRKGGKQMREERTGGDNILAMLSVIC